MSSMQAAISPALAQRLARQDTDTASSSSSSVPAIDQETLTRVHTFLRDIIDNQGRGFVDGVERVWDEQQLFETCTSLGQFCKDGLPERTNSSLCTSSSDPLFSALASLSDQRSSRKKRSDKHVFKWPALNNLRKHHEQLVSSVLHEASSLAQLPGDLSAHVEHAKAHIASFHTFDVSDLAERSRQPLKVVTLAAFLHLELDDKLDLDVPRLCAFAEAIEGLYRAECPYHNSTHAADVVQALVFLLCEDGLVHKFTPLELAAGLIAAVIHDVGHPGVNNQFLDAAGDQLSRLFGRHGTGERMSVAIGVEVLQQPDFHFLPALSRADGAQVATLVHDAILGTDMARHKEVLNSLSTCFGGGAPRSHAWSAADRKVLMTALLHTADLSAPARPPALAGTWARAVCEEFFLQAEREADLGLELAAPSPQRGASTIWKSQVAFADMVLLPMHAAMAAVAPRAAAAMRDGVLANRARWEALQSSGDPQAVICAPGDAAAPALHVYGGQAVDLMFDDFPIAPLLQLYTCPMQRALQARQTSCGTLSGNNDRGGSGVFAALMSSAERSQGGGGGGSLDAPKKEWVDALADSRKSIAAVAASSPIQRLVSAPEPPALEALSLRRGSGAGPAVAFAESPILWSEPGDAESAKSSCEGSCDTQDARQSLLTTVSLEQGHV